MPGRITRRRFVFGSAAAAAAVAAGAVYARFGEPHWLEYLAAWPAEETSADEGSRPVSVAAAAAAASSPALEESSPAAAAAPVAIVETTTETKTTETTIYIDSSSIRA